MVSQNPAVPTQLEQLTTAGAPIVVGGTTDEIFVMFRARVSDPDSCQVRLQVEVRTVGTNWIGPIGSSAFVSSGDLAVVVVGLPTPPAAAAAGNWKWQARTNDINGASSDWVAFGGNADGDTDFTCAPGAGTIPAVPTSVDQYRSDGVTAITVGATTNESRVLIRATLTDPDAGNGVRLQVESRNINTQQSAATHSSLFVPSGSTVTIEMTSIANNSYYWRFRAQDGQGNVSAWTSFGGNNDYGAGRPSAPTAAASAALAAAGAGNVDNGTHTWVYTYVTAGGESSNSPATGIVTVADNAVDGRVALTGITVGPAGTTARRIYRTVAGNTGSRLFVAEISDNTTTTFQDNVADAGLGAVVPAGADVDFTVATGGNTVPNAPTSPNQFTTSDVIIAAGGEGGTTVRFKATVSDPNLDGVRFQVEVKPNASAFNNIVSGESALVASGSLASVDVGSLPAGSYHWQYRVVDGSGSATAWTAFGGNPDFTVPAAPVSSGRSKKRCGLLGWEAVLVAGLMLIRRKK